MSQYCDCVVLQRNISQLQLWHLGYFCFRLSQHHRSQPHLSYRGQWEFRWVRSREIKKKKKVVWMSLKHCCGSERRDHTWLRWPVGRERHRRESFNSMRRLIYVHKGSIFNQKTEMFTVGMHHFTKRVEFDSNLIYIYFLTYTCTTGISTYLQIRVVE